jgi:hypothetical protein
MEENSTARQIMAEFARRTGIPASDETRQRRYLWTDAFGVCNYLTLYKQSGRDEYLDTAVRLVDQVHQILGRHRPDDPRSGWLSGLDERDGRLHPTAGGLRIGKKLPERQADESYDEDLEWERDGQYYHYLTKWMHCLCRIGRVTGNPTYTAWAAELAARAHKAFCHNGENGPKRLYWKMSIDLSRPQVDSMGHHDPLDGLLTCVEIRDQTLRLSPAAPYDLTVEIKELADMCRRVNWTTPDPLGLGGLLADAWRLAQLQGMKAGIALPGLLTNMLDAAGVGLSLYTRDNSMHLTAAYRLAFRELGLSIGLQAIARMETLVTGQPDLFRHEPGLIPLLANLKQYIPLQEQIEQFWLKEENRKVPSWKEHGDINMVMLATSLAPDGYLDL